MTAVCYFFIYAFELFISLFYFNSKFEPKRKAGVFCAVFAFFLCVQYGFGLLNIPYLNLATFIVSNFLICFFCYDTKISQALFNSCLLTAIMLITELVVVYLFWFVSGIDASEHNSNEIVLLIQSGSTKLLYFLIAFLISKFSGRESRSDLHSYKTVFLILLPAASITFLLGIVRITEVSVLSQSSFYVFSIATVLLMYANIVVFWVHESSIKYQKENTALQLQTQKAKLDTAYYTMLQKQYDNSGILIHDIKRHLLSIKNLADEKNCSDIIKYIDNLYGEYDVKNIKKYSENKLINVIVNRYAIACSEDGIDFFCDIRDIDFSFISDNDLTAILDNLLENALEAARSSAEKKIDLFIFSANTDYVVIKTTNSCAAAPPVKGGKLVTTKKDAAAHGYGTKSIKRTVKNYSGSLSFDYSEADSTFCTKIVLKTNG